MAVIPLIIDDSDDKRAHRRFLAARRREKKAINEAGKAMAAVQAAAGAGLDKTTLAALRAADGLMRLDTSLDSLLRRLKETAKGSQVSAAGTGARQ